MSIRELNKNARRTAILDAARTLIQQGKSKDFSMPDLAAKAGVSLVTPYNLFGSKSNILLEIARADILQRGVEINRVPAVALDLWVVDMARILARVYYANRHFYRRLTITLTAQETAEAMRELNTLNYGLFQDALHRLRLAGALPDGPSVETIARHLSRSVVVTTQDCLLERGSEDRLRREILNGMVLLLAGCARPEDKDKLLRQLA
jgi:AcrR family transcriptional regulator